MKSLWPFRKRNPPKQAPPRLSLRDKYKLYRILKDPTMLQKLKSRKLWVTVITAGLMALGSQLGIDPEMLEKIMAVAMTYIAGESIVDAAHARKPVIEATTLLESKV